MAKFEKPAKENNSTKLNLSKSWLNLLEIK